MIAAGCLETKVLYNTGRFKRATIKGLVDGFDRALRALIASCQC
jgi:hypothetical protein